jgi:hypothetical protein
MLAKEMLWLCQVYDNNYAEIFKEEKTGFYPLGC